MKTILKKISDKDKEQVTIECVEVTQEILTLQAYAEGVGSSISAVIDGRMANVSLGDILYFEAVDEKVFAYLAGEVAEVKGRLYEYESSLSQKGFVRISKSVLLHLKKVNSISPAPGRKFIAELCNGECVVISRQYIKYVKQILLGGKINEF